MQGKSNVEGKGVIYYIRNRINDKKYIGQTIDFKRRKWEHKNELFNNKHRNLELQQDFNKYGFENFEVVILEYCNNRKQLLERETYWINYYSGIESKSIYNMQDNKHCNKLMRTFNSNGQKGKCVKDSTKKKISETEKAYYKNHINSFQGKHHTQVTKEYLSKLKKQEYLTNPNYGMTCKKHTDKTKQILHEKGLARADLMRKLNTKYINDFISNLKIDYEKLGTYKKVAEKYNLDAPRVYNLIKYGTTSGNRKCNDYPKREYKSNDLEAKTNL